MKPYISINAQLQKETDEIQMQDHDSFNGF